MRSGDDLAADLLRRGGPLRIKARGASMVPFLWDGDVVLVVPSTGTEVGVGDVICYETSPGRLFLHRVIERRRERFVAHGHALPSTDAIDRPHIPGKPFPIEPRGSGKRPHT